MATESRHTRRTIGILTDWIDTNSNYHTEIMSGIRHFAAEHDLNLNALVIGQLYGSDHSEQSRNRLIDFVNTDAYDGMLVYTASIGNFSSVETFEKQISRLISIPTVSMGAKLREHTSVLLDNHTGLEDVIRHLIEDHKYTKIAFITGSMKNPDSMERKQIFINMMQRYGLPVPDSHIYEGDFLMREGRYAVRDFFDRRRLTLDAIVCANDDIAIGVWEELLRRGVSIPDDIAVTGFDNRNIRGGFDFQLTTVNQPLYEMGYISASMLNELITENKGPASVSDRILPTYAVFRESCGCITHEMEIPRRITDDDYRFVMEQKDILKRAMAIKTIETDTVHPPFSTLWRKFVIRSFEHRIKIRNVQALPELIQLELKDEGFDLTGTDFDPKEMATVASEIYRQSEIISNLIENDFQHYITLFVENIFHTTAAKTYFDDSQGTFCSLLKTIETSFCSISRFNPPVESNGTASVIYAYRNGAVVTPPKEANTYSNTFQIPPMIVPSHRYEIVTSLLYEDIELLGMLHLAMDARGSDIHERLRTRLSGIIYSINITQNLHAEITERVKIERKLKIALADLEDLSLSDELTGLYNRRGFLTLAEQALKTSIREKKASMIFFIDMDGLKYINDTYGHEAGDSAIVMIADILKRSFRTSDIIGRLGGDEFAVFCENASGKHQNRFRSRIESSLAGINNKADRSFPVSMSFGSAVYDPKNGIDTIQNMLTRADAKMYSAKKLKHTGMH
ncbi:MAG: diguanylate cyclase [Spirochaetota bacterium]